MENTSNNNLSKFALPLVAVVIIIIAVVAVYTSTKDSNTVPAPANQESQVTNQPATEDQASQYKDGIYSAQGSYVSPGGPREIGLTITLENNVITDTTFEGNAEDPASKRFQGEFGDNYSPLIIGKNIDEVTLTKVSGSSLTPKGFTDALEKIKTEAQS